MKRTLKLSCLLLLFAMAVYGHAQPSAQKPKRILLDDWSEVILNAKGDVMK